MKEKFKDLLEEVKIALEIHGIELNEDEITVRDVADYILNCDDENYSVEQWIEDTGNNYPECFL